MESYRLNNLSLLEAEGIHILREVAASFERPVMLYSAGKDSSVMVRLAQKAFHPGKIPFPLLHVDTTMKFKEMYVFYNRFTKEIGAELNAKPKDLYMLFRVGITGAVHGPELDRLPLVAGQRQPAPVGGFLERALPVEPVLVGQAIGGIVVPGSGGLDPRGRAGGAAV